jgi:acyl-CoA synthetase (AMP-forming)/AMP-acid ligase II
MVLKECEEVTAALVIAIPVGPAKQLVAYVTPKLSTEEIEEVRARCGLKMPEYMVPSFIIPLAQFPISPATGT